MGNFHNLRTKVSALLVKYPTLRHVSILVTGTALAQLVSMAVAFVTARIFTPETFGQFAIYGSVTAIAVTIASLKLDMAMMLPEDDDAAKRLARMATIANIGVSVLTSILALLFWPFVADFYGSEDLASWLCFGGLTVFFLAQAAIMQYWFNRKTNYAVISANRVQQTVGSSLGQLGFGLAGMQSLAGLVLGTSVGQAYAWFNLRRKSGEMREPVSAETPSSKALLVRYKGMPLLTMPTTLVDSIRANGIPILIGTVALGAVGQFNLAWRILQVPVALINSAVSQVFFQKLARVKPGDMFSLVRSTIIRSLLLSVPPFALIYITAPWLFTLLFGAQWDQAGDFARALTPWLMMQLATSPISTVFVVTEKQGWMLVFSVVFAVAPLSLLYFSKMPLLVTTMWLGILMALMLAVMLVMSLIAAKIYDSSVQKAE